MMYEKLVNRLRKAAGPAIDFPDTLYDEAADAIEELDTLLDGVSADNEALCETIEMLKKQVFDMSSLIGDYSEKTRWIPVTEREKLPKSGSYLVAYKVTENSEPMVGISEIAWWSTRSDAFEPFYKHGVTHWMPKPSPPLPEPPKEEK